MLWLALFTVVSLSNYVKSTSYDALDLTSTDYQDDMIQSLYKRLSHLDNGYFKGDFDPAVAENTGFRLRVSDYDASYNTPTARSYGQADIRDSEYLAHSANAANSGYIYISGGAGEGKQHLNPDGVFDNIGQVKSDESLPFYCHPPNPCPKGFTSEMGCQEFIDDTAKEQQEWIDKMQRKGLCSCDEEHMFNCPKDESMVSKVNEDEDTSKLDEVISNILKNKLDHNMSSNPYIGGQKRHSLVAKKSPRIKRSAMKLDLELEKMTQTPRKSNPYLNGQKLRTVAKKGFSQV